MVTDLKVGDRVRIIKVIDEETGKPIEDDSYIGCIGTVGQIWKAGPYLVSLVIDGDPMGEDARYSCNPEELEKI